MAQGKRAVSLCGLITPRSLDRNGLPVSNSSPALQKWVVIAQATLNLSILKTSLAQRQSAGLITLVSADQNPQEVFYSNSPALQKRVVIAQATINLSTI